MAITRAQQVRQMLEDGGMLVQPSITGKRPGYRGDAASKAAEARGDKTSRPGPGPGERDRRDSGESDTPGFNPNTGIFEKPDGTPEGARTPKEVKQDLRTAINKGAFRKKGFFDAVFPMATNLIDSLGRTKLARINNALQRQNYIDSLDLNDPKEKAEYDRIMNELGGLGIDIIAGPETLTDTSLKQPMSLGPPKTTFKPSMSFDDGVSSLGDPDVKKILGEGYEDYLNRFDSPDRDDRGPSDPCLGPNPPAYCFIGKKADDTIAAAPPVPMFRFMNRGGMVEDAPMGTGIMDLESARQMMFIGGVAKAIGKGLKSATRAVKKVVKSPFGKAALLAAPFVMSGGGSGLFSGLKGKLLGLRGVEEFGGKAGLLKDLGLIKGGFGEFGGLTGAGIGSLFGIGTLLASMQEPKEDENFNLDNYYETEGLKNFIASLGQRNRFLAEGGKAEPVAKKTMPLLDLDGKEMDFRAEGGFVPIGRMEKADDVPARLSKNEFVFTADAVRNAGDGDVDKGAEVMYNTMKNLEAGGKVSEETQGLDGAKEMFQTAQRLEGVM